MTRDSFAALPPGAAPTRSQVQGVVEARRRAVDAIAALTPPDAMAPEHGVLVTALEAFVSAGEEFLEDTRHLGPAAFDTALDEATHIDALAKTVNSACRSWERRATELVRPVELGC